MTRFAKKFSGLLEGTTTQLDYQITEKLRFFAIEREDGVTADPSDAPIRYDAFCSKIYLVAVFCDIRLRIEMGVAMLTASLYTL